MPRSQRLLIVSNRLPITLTEQEGRVLVHESTGGLATGLRAPHERSGGRWIGWLGHQLDRVPAEQRAEVEDQIARRRLVPVPLSDEEVETFYDRVSNAVLWPLFHDRLDRHTELDGRSDGAEDVVDIRLADQS